jgi:hypothetical protein
MKPLKRRRGLALAVMMTDLVLARVYSDAEL